MKLQTEAQELETRAMDLQSKAANMRAEAARLLNPYSALLELPAEMRNWIYGYALVEEDYIIVSVVRTEKPGFLTNTRRTNVMLSRCKRGMVICASREFLDGKAKAMLMGRLSLEWKDGWISWRDVLQGKFLNVKGC